MRVVQPKRKGEAARNVGGTLMRYGFGDRREAGQRLATYLTTYAGREDVVVLGLPRGGVPVAYEVARALHVPLDVLLVRKLGLPDHEELAMGAIASGGIQVLNDAVWTTSAFLIR